MQPLDTAHHEKYMREALWEAEKAFLRGDRPIGAVVVHRDQIISRASNSFVSERSYLAHAELKALLNCAAYLYDYGPECILYSTLEPCTMCQGAAVMTNIKSIIYGMPDHVIGARAVIENVRYVKEKILYYQGGVLENECVELYKKFSETKANLLLGKA